MPPSFGTCLVLQDTFVNDLLVQWPLNLATNIYVDVYEGMKAHLQQTSLHDSLLTLIISGGFAGIAAWLPCYPQDVIKSRMQSNPVKMTLTETVKCLFRESGFRGFFKGLTPTMIRAFPANAATFLGYEFVMKLFKDDINEIPDIEIE